MGILPSSYQFPRSNRAGSLFYGNEEHYQRGVCHRAGENDCSGQSLMNKLKDIYFLKSVPLFGASDFYGPPCANAISLVKMRDHSWKFRHTCRLNRLYLCPVKAATGKNYDRT
jgi:hypothetical protein